MANYIPDEQRYDGRYIEMWKMGDKAPSNYTGDFGIILVVQLLKFKKKLFTQHSTEESLTLI